MTPEHRFDLDYATAHLENRLGDECAQRKAARKAHHAAIPQKHFGLVDGKIVEIDQTTAPSGVLAP